MIPMLLLDISAVFSPDKGAKLPESFHPFLKREPLSACERWKENIFLDIDTVFPATVFSVTFNVYYGTCM